MQTVPDEMLAEMQASSNTPIARVTIGDSVLGIDAIQSVNITELGTADGSFGVGTTASATANLVLLSSALPLVFTADDITVEYGYRLADGTELYVPVGVFGTNDSLVSSSSLFTTITAHDAFFWMDEAMTKTWTVGHTVTTRTMMEDMLKGTSIRYDIGELPNLDLMQWRPSGTLRECIGQVCAAAMVNARFDGRGNLRFSRPKSTGMFFDTAPTDGSASPVSSLNISSDYANEIDHVAATFTKTYEILDSENYEPPADETVNVTAPETATGLAVTFDPVSFTTEGTFICNTSSGSDGGLSLAKADLQRIAARAQDEGLLPVALRGFDITLHGYPQMEPFDTFTVRTFQGERVNVTATSVTWGYDGALFTSMSAVASAQDASAPTAGSAATIASIAESVNSIKAKNLALTSLTVNSLKGDNAKFNDVMADTLTADEAFISKLTASSAFISYLTASEAFIDSITASAGFIKKLVANELWTDTLSASSAFVTKLAANTVFTSLLGTSEAFIKTLTASEVFTNLMDASYADVEFSNVVVEHVQQSFVQDLLVQGSIIAQEGTIYYLDAVHIKGDHILAGTVEADKLVLRGPGGLLYQINLTNTNVQDGTLDITEIPTDDLQNFLHGDNIIAGTITADKILVSDLFALNATIGGWVIAPDSLYAGAKDGFESMEAGAYLGADGKLNIGSENEYLSFDPTTGELNIRTNHIFLASGANLDDIFKLYMDFDGRTMTLGHIDNNMKLRLTNGGVGFINLGDLQAYLTGNMYYARNISILQSQRFNNFIWESRSNGNMSLRHLDADDVTSIPRDIYDMFDITPPGESEDNMPGIELPDGYAQKTYTATFTRKWLDEGETESIDITTGLEPIRNLITSVTIAHTAEQPAVTVTEEHSVFNTDVVVIATGPGNIGTVMITVTYTERTADMVHEGGLAPSKDLMPSESLVPSRGEWTWQM